MEALPEVKETSLFQPRWRARLRCAPLAKSEAGQSLVEFALLIPLLLLILLGTLEFGRLAYIAIEVNSAARAAVQYGAQNSITAEDNAGMLQAALQDAPDLQRLTLTPAPNVFCQCSGSPGTNIVCTSTCASGRLLVFVQVNTSAQYKTFFPYPGRPASMTVKGQAIMPVGQ